MSHEEGGGGPGAISNILAVAGFIILIAIIVWGSFHFLNLASSGFSSFFPGGGNDEIDLTLSPEEVNSGTPLDVTWDYEPENAGTFFIVYQCVEGFQFRIVDSAGVVNALACGNSYAIGPTEMRTVRLVPALTGTAEVEVPFTVLYIEQSASEAATSTPPTPIAEGSATVTVMPASATQTPPVATTTPPTTQTPSTPTTPSTNTGVVEKPKPAGSPDLVVRIIGVGTIDPYTNLFVNRVPNAGETAAVKFDVVNTGTAASGAWYFSASLPTSPMSPYFSQVQRSLTPGSRIENTLRFGPVAAGGGFFSVTIDPANAVRESNESNNYVGQMVSVNYNYYPYFY